MKLIRPEGFLSQPFAANYNPSYKNGGLKGHTGEDYVLGFKKEINAVVTGEVFSILNEHNPNTTKYRAVFQLVDDGQFVYEVSYGHIDTALCEEGQVVTVGQPIATEGNWGTCYSGGKLVTPEEKPTGKGSHLHFQVRKCIKVKKRSSKKQYIRNSEGYVKLDGNFIEVVDYDNGYNGCVSPEPFYQPDYEFTRDLYLGCEGEDVRELQKFLNKKGFTVAPFGNGSKGKETTYFGYLTRYALIRYQRVNKIYPSIGYFGEITRAHIKNNP